MTVFLVLIIVALVVVSDIVFFAWWIKRLRAEAVEDLRETIGDEQVYHVEGCNFFGLQSSGYKQWRGNGMLALTGKGIHFRMFIPRKYIFIPAGSIKEISNPRSFLGKSKARTLLRVDFVNDAGEEDACAWLVPSLQWWMDALASMMSGEEPPSAPWEKPRRS